MRETKKFVSLAEKENDKLFAAFGIQKDKSGSQDCNITLKKYFYLMLVSGRILSFSSQSHFWKILLRSLRIKLRTVSIPSFVTVDSELFIDSRDTDNRKTKKKELGKSVQKKLESQSEEKNKTKKHPSHDQSNSRIIWAVFQMK